ncbi:MAG: hypothetical protein IJV08_04430 [Bacteroidaceae bacterium]|nr:hypothetical protein [Bacteroidaceae bacterium]
MAPGAVPSFFVSIPRPLSEAKNVYQDLQDFTDPSWEWNYQPRKGWFSIRHKSLQLKAFQPLEKGNLLKAGNTIVQRVWRSPENVVTVRLDCRQMADGQRSGLCHFAHLRNGLPHKKMSPRYLL